MGRFKSPKGTKKPAPTRGLIPCLIVILAGMALMTLFFSAMLKSGS